MKESPFKDPRTAVMTIVVIMGITLGVACAKPKNAALEQARNSYQGASADPIVAKNAPVELHDAQNYITQAESAEKTAEIEQYAYLAEQKVKAARSAAEIKNVNIEQETIKDQRSEILLNAREKEIRSAKRKTKIAENNALDATDRAAMADERATEATNRADNADDKNVDLQNRLNDMQSKTTDRGLEFTLQGMLFELNKSVLKPGGERPLGKLALVIKENPDRQVLIEGHTDNLGAASYNLDLSKQRAQSVENYLQKAGIEQSRMSVKGYGLEYPIAPNNTEAGRQQNRRVEVVLLNKGETSDRMNR